MRVVIDASPEELREKRELLLSELAKAVRPADPDLATALEQVSPDRGGERVLRHPALRGLADQWRQEYARLTDVMVERIAGVLATGPSAEK